MAINEFVPFAAEPGANVITQAQYVQLAQRLTGFTAGMAISEQLNKAWRQPSVMAAAVAQFICDRTGEDVLDDGDLAKLGAQLYDALYRGIATDTQLADQLTQVHTFTAPGTFVLPPGAKVVEFDVISGGGGGASGSSVTGAGGAGGTGGGRTIIRVNAAELAPSMAVMVGEAGLGGVAIAGDGHVAGTLGGQSWVAVRVARSIVAPRGVGALNNVSVSGSQGGGVIGAVASGAGSTNTFVGSSVLPTYATALAGGSGAGGGSANGTQGSRGGMGGGGGMGTVTGTAGIGGAENGGVGGNAPQPAVLSDYPWYTSAGGSGGGGGALSGGNGGKGDGYGSGGGGGGGCGPGQVPGAGGDGQPGLVVIRVYF